MTENGISRELWPHVHQAEAAAIDRIAERLIEERPLPRAGLRAELRAELATSRRGAAVLGVPRRLGVAIAAYAGSGVVLLAVAALGLAGVGPLAT